MDLLCYLMDLSVDIADIRDFSSLSSPDLYFSFLSALRVTASFAMYLYFMSNEFCLALDGLQDGMILHFCGPCLHDP